MVVLLFLNAQKKRVVENGKQNNVVRIRRTLNYLQLNEKDVAQRRMFFN